MPSEFTVVVPTVVPSALITLAVCVLAPSLRGTEPETTVSSVVISAACGLPTSGDVL